MINSTQLPPHITSWVRSALGSTSTTDYIRQLQGSTSAELFLLDISEGGKTTQLVLRLLTNRQWLLEEPGLAEHEAGALRLASQSGLPVPQLIAFDAHGSRCGLPAVLMTRVQGEVNLLPADFDGWLRQMAAALAPLHALDADDLKWKYYSYNKPEKLTVPVWSARPDLWQKAIQIVNQPAPPTRHCFIHRDYHPMNTLWQGLTLSGIVDWINACRGPEPYDLAWNRLNLMSMYGLQAADRLRDLAIEICGTSVWHPYWDLMALIELLPGPLEVYPPWPQFGLDGLTSTLLCTRAEDYLTSLVGLL